VTGLYRAIWDLVGQVPSGRVVTYGQIAEVMGCGPRQVGYALHALPPGSDVPWHRVVGAGGCISLRDPDGPALEQICRLRAEGVEVTDSGRIDLHRFSPGSPGDGV